MNIVNFSEFTKESLNMIVDNALIIKKEPKSYSDVCKNRTLYLLFEKTSTRTAVSFDRAMVELGGTTLTQKFEDTNFCVGEIRDEVRYIGRNFDIIMARMKLNDTIREMAQYSSVPVINGCCNKYHPCQALADVMTIKEIFGRYEINMIYIGVWNNVLNSLIETLPKLGGKLYVLTPIINESSFDQNIVDKAKDTGNFEILDSKMSTEQLKEIVKGMDIVYTDTWVDLEFFNNQKYADVKNERISMMMPYQVNRELLDGSKAIVMHDMPMHSGYEISRETIEDNIDTILLQAENRRHIEKGVLIEVDSVAKQRFEELRKNNA